MIRGPPTPSVEKVKFNQNQPMNEEIDVFEERGEGLLIINFFITLAQFVSV